MNDIKKEDEIYCPECAEPIKKDFTICPYCRTEIKNLNISPPIKADYNIGNAFMEPEKFKVLDDNPVPEPEKVPENEIIEKKSLTKIQKYIAIAAIGILIGAGIAGGVTMCAINQERAVATADAEATQNPQANAVEQNSESISEAMKIYEAMSIKDFETLPLDVRLLYSQDVINRDISKIRYDMKYGDGKPGHDYAVEYTPASKDNSGQEILNNQMFVSQMAYVQSKVDNDGERFNMTEAVKVVSSNFYNVDTIENQISNSYNGEKDAMKTLTKPVYLSNVYTATDTSDLFGGSDDNGDSIQYKTVTFSDQDGNVYNARFVYYKSRSSDNAPRTVWLLDTIKKQ